MRRCVIYNVGLVLFKDLIDPAAVAHRTDEDFQLQIRLFVSQLQLNGVSIVFVNIKDDKLLRLMGRNLTAQLTAD